MIAACSVVVAAVSMCFSGVCKVYLRRKYGAKMAKIRCGNGEIVVRLRRFLCVIQAVARFICGENTVLKRQNGGAKTAKYGAEMAKWWCICGVYMLDFLHLCCQGGEIVVRLRRLVVWLRGFRVWFLYDLVADAAFGNL